MAIIYQILELADAAGRPTGKFQHVSYSDEAADRVYTKLLDKTFNSREAARADPEARAALDRVFRRGPHAPRDERDELIVTLGTALAKARRALRLAEARCRVSVALSDDEYALYARGQSDTDVACADYYDWRAREGLLTDVEQATKSVDPDAKP